MKRATLQTSFLPKTFQFFKVSKRNIDTNKNTKAWAASQHTDTSMNTKAWAVSQPTNTSKNTNEMLNTKDKIK